MPNIIKLVDDLYSARQTGQSLNRDELEPLFATLTMAQAYRIQHAVTAKQQAMGLRLAGYKISTANPATHSPFDTDEPLYGQMMSNQLLLAKDTLSLRDMNRPWLDFDMVFVAQQDLLINDTPQKLCQKCLIAPCLTIQDSRYANWSSDLSEVQLCVDAVGSSQIRIGNPVHADYTMIAQAVAQLSHNDKVCLTEPTSIVMGHPALALKWLVDKLDSQGLHIHAGMFVATSSFGMPITLKAGRYVGSFTGIGRVALDVEA